MRKNLSKVVVCLSAVALAIAFFMPTTTATKVAASGNSTEEKEVVVEIPQPDPAEVEGERQMEATIEEGTKLENKSVAGVKSDADGLYLANDVNGIALKAKEGSDLSDVRVTTLDTDPKKSSAALAVANNVAAQNNLEVGPSVDIYLQNKTAKGLTDGSIDKVGSIAVGLPGNMRGAAEYKVIVVLPGGTSYVLPATPSADGRSITFDPSSIDTTNAKSNQVMVSICKAK